MRNDLYHTAFGLGLCVLAIISIAISDEPRQGGFLWWMVIAFAVLGVLRLLMLLSTWVRQRGQR